MATAPAPAAEPATPTPPPPNPNAPPTPSRAYDEAQCKTRVELYAKRAMDAFKHSDASLQLRERTVSSTTADADVSAPDVVVSIARSSGPAGDFCGAWLTELVVKGKTVSKQQGKKRDAATVAAVKKRLSKGGTIGVNLPPRLDLATVVPLLVELGNLGPLALRVATDAPSLQLPTAEAPAWAVERYRAMEKSDSPSSIISAGIRDSAIGCPAHKVANDKVVNDESGNKGYIVAIEYPKAVAACKCTNIDVDALELFTLVALGGPAPAQEAYLALRIDAASTARVKAPKSDDLASELAKLARDQRNAGIAFEASEATSRFPERCR